MKIRTDYIYPPIPDRSCDWVAVDDDTYDGPEAIADLMEQLEQ